MRITRIAIALAVLLVTVVADAFAVGTFIPAAGRKDVVHDSKRDLVYISAGDSILRYRLADGTFLAPIVLGGQLLGMDISPDASLLAVADDNFSPVGVWIHLVNLADGTSRRLTASQAVGETGTFAVAFGANGWILASSRFMGSGWTPLRRFHPTTGAVVVLPEVRQDTMLAPSGDRTRLGFAEANSSDGPWGRYTFATESLERRQGYTDGTSQSNFEIGTNRDGSQFAIPTYGGTYFYDDAFTRVATIGNQGLDQPIGVAYHPVENLAYFPWATTTQVKAFDTTTFTEVGSYEFENTFPHLGSEAFVQGRTRLSLDGSLLMVTVEGGVRFHRLYAPLQAMGATVGTTGAPVDIALGVTIGNGGALAFSIASGPAGGTATLDGSSARYTPSPGFRGKDTFVYRVAYGLASAEATVSVVTGTALANGVASGGVSGTASGSQYFFIDVPPGATSLTVSTTGSGGRGDNADLYVRREGVPSVGVFDCASAGATSTEACSIANPAPGRYFILLYGTGPYSGVSVQASYAVAGPGTLSLGLSGTAPSITEGTGSTTVAVTRTGGTLGIATGTLGVSGGCTLSGTTVSFADSSATPSPATVTVSAGTATAGAACTVTLSAAGASLGTPNTTHIAIAAIPSVGTALANGVPLTGQSGAAGSSTLFYIDVPSGATGLTVSATGSGGRGDNADLYVRMGSVPTTVAFDCVSAGSTSTETCSFTNPPAGRYFILLYGTAAFSGVSVRASFGVAGPGSLSLNLAGTASSITVGTGSTTLAVARGGGTLGAVTGSLGVTGGCALSTPSVSFADGSAAPSPATVTVLPASATAGSTCTVTLSATGASLGSPASAAIAVVAAPTVGTPIANGVAVTGLSGAAGSSTYFYIDIPTGITSLTVTTAGTGGRGDNADLYVRLGSLPATGAFDCASAGGTSAETCTLTNPSAGRYYILLSGAGSYSGVSLQATYSQPSPGTLSLDLSGTASSILASTGSTSFAVRRTGGTSGAATGFLSVIFGGCTLSTASVGFADTSAAPSPAVVTLSAGSTVAGGSCTVSLTAATGAVIGSPSVAYISVASAPPPSGTPLANGQTVSGLSGAAGSSRYFYIDVPANATNLTVQTSGGGRGSNVDLYLRKDGIPTTATYDCRSNGATNAERCSLANPATGRYFVMLYGTAGYSGVDLVATYAAPVAPDSTPDPIGFLSQTAVAPGSVIISGAITPTGYNVPAPISVSGGEYSIDCAGTFTSAAGTINPGQSVCVRHTSPAGIGATVTALTIGGQSGTFMSTTSSALLSAGSVHHCAVTAAGGVKCWGGNRFGQLGDGSTVDRSTPVDVVGLASGVVAIAAGYRHTCALVTGGGVKCWGLNQDGELGDGTTTDRYTPVDVPGLSIGVRAISAGLGHTCALMTGGGIKCWGDNLFGQLGNGGSTNRLTPADVIGLTSGATAITAGSSHTCAVTNGGGVKCWGANSAGALGDGTIVNQSVPINVTGLASGVTAISAGHLVTCALTMGGSVSCWGANNYGQVGDGTTTDRYIPVAVPALASGVVGLSAVRSLHACGLLSTGGRIKCWGENLSGELGDGNVATWNEPVDVIGVTGAVAVAAGSESTCALVYGGGIKCWGGNQWGELGDGTLTNRLSPVDVSGFAGSP